MEVLDNILKKETLAPWQEMDGKALVITPQKSSVHELNPTATFVWKKIDGATSVRTIIESLCEDFDVTSEQATTDVVGLISEMKEKGLLIG
mgnify:CR=1 FL=1